MKSKEHLIRKQLYTTVFSHCFSPCGKYVAAANNYGDIALFSLTAALAPDATEKSWDPIFTFKDGDSSAIYTLASTEEYLISAGCHNICARRWTDIIDESPKIVWTLTIPKSSNMLPFSKVEVNSICIDKQDDGSQKLYAGCGDNKVHSWDMHSGQLVKSYTGHEDYVHSIALRNNGNECLSASEDGSLRIWDTRNGEQVHIIEPHKNQMCARPDKGKWLGCVVTDDSSDWMLCGGGPSLCMWRLKSLQATTVFETPKSCQKTAIFHEDTIISAGSASEVNHWDIAGDLKSQVPASPSDVLNVAINPHKDGPKVLSVSGSSSKIDISTNFGYKAFSFNFIPCS